MKENKYWRQFMLWFVESEIDAEKVAKLKALFKTLQFQTDVLENNKKEIKFVRQEIAKTKAEIEMLLKNK